MITVEARLAIAGYHYYKDAPVEVAFLREVHRHLFHFSAEVIVDDRNREVEFFILQGKMREAILGAQGVRHDGFIGFTLPYRGIPASCEMMATWVAEQLQRFGYTTVHVRVSEDDENAGHWYRDHVHQYNGDITKPWLSSQPPLLLERIP